MRAQLVAHLGECERLDRALEIAGADEARLGAEQLHRVVEMECPYRERRQIERAKVGHENGVASAGDRIMTRIGGFQPGEGPLAGLAQSRDVAVQFRKLRQVHVQRRRRKVEQDMLNLVVPGQLIELVAQIKK